MVEPFLPEYEFPFKPVPQVTPLTYRDGLTMLKKLDSISRYLNKVMVPFVNENYAELADNFETQVNALITAVNAAIQTVLDDSVEVQDIVVAEIFENEDSATRNVTDLIYASFAIETLVVSGRLSQTALDARYALKSAFDAYVTSNNAALALKAATTYVDSQDAAITAARVAGDNALNLRLDAIEPLLTGGGRLTETYLDNRYVNEFLNPHMVMIGTSNSTPATVWPSDLASDLGVTLHNYSVGGGGFTASGTARFNNQTDTAIADNSFPKANVKYVIIADTSNDMRGEADITDEAQEVFLKLRTAYPNARIICLPAIYTLAPDNIIPNRLRSISRRYYEMTGPAADYDVELINYSWTWLFDSVGWIESSLGVHPTMQGYQFIRKQMRRYIQKGGDTDRPLGWKMGVAQAAVPSDYMYLQTRRSGNFGQLKGRFLANDLAIDTAVAQMQTGANPLEDTHFLAVSNDSPRASAAMVIYPNGLVRSFGVMDAPGSNTFWNVDVTYPVF